MDKCIIMINCRIDFISSYLWIMYYLYIKYYAPDVMDNTIEIYTAFSHSKGHSCWITYKIKCASYIYGFIIFGNA